VFQDPSPAPRFPARFLAVSVLIHATVILLLLGLSFPGPPSSFRAPRIKVALVVPVLDPDRPAPVRTPELRKILPARPRVFHPASRPVYEVPSAPPMVEVPREIPGAAVPAPMPLRSVDRLSPPTLAAPIKTGAFADVQVPAVTGAPQVGIKAAGFDTSRADAAAPRRAALVHTSVRVSGFPDPPVAAHGAAPPAIVASAGFGDATVAAPAAPTHPAAAPARITPVEILDKPRPAYTEEARRLAVEGEVLIEVLFEASGQTRVQRLVRGLGHGLDENALSAARQIRFRPARQDGAAVDALAVVHILFQLAY
jgi:TonB family protein